jgi:hypothetical protein
VHESFENMGSDTADAFPWFVGNRLSCLRDILELASVTLDVSAKWVRCSVEPVAKYQRYMVGICSNPMSP